MKSYCTNSSLFIPISYFLLDQSATSPKIARAQHFYETIMFKTNCSAYCTCITVSITVKPYCFLPTKSPWEWVKYKYIIIVLRTIFYY